ncbi:hypothetical protein Henu3_gp41 [Mycobacterium phage Henu3 PeY-2017]|nr:hypothetical protein Henu3_gp41 [Mycobacterium phage Henu3 PeY-2017]
MGEPEDPTELAGVADADTMSAYAWSVEDPTINSELIDAGSDRPFWITTAAVGLSLSLVAVVGVLGYRVWVDVPERPTVVVAATPTTTTEVEAASPLPLPPPVTVTTVVVQTPAPAPAPVPVPEVIPSVLPTPLPPLSNTDMVFLSRMRAQGWYVSDPQLMAYRAFETCAMLRNGEPVWQVQGKLLGLEGVPNEVEASKFLNTAMSTYPNCP